MGREMARYYKDHYTRLETCVIDEEKKEIYVSAPTTFIKLHRELQDLFDDCDWMIHPSPTARITDERGETLPPWKFHNTNVIYGTIHRWDEDNE